MPKRKPYRYSKKAGRYISNTQRGNIEFYFNYLETIIQKKIGVDPNKTFGKLLIKKSIPKLRSHKKLENQLNNAKNEIKLFKGKFSKVIEYERGKIDSELRKKRFIIQNEISSTNLIYKVQNSTSFIYLYLLLFIVSSHLLQSTGFFYVSLNIILGIYLFKLINREASKIFDSNKDVNQEKVDKKKIDLHVQNVKSDLNLKFLLMDKRLNILIKKVFESKNEIILFTDNFLENERLKFILGEKFYSSMEWRSLREKIFKNKLKKCVKCGSKYDLEVDHIKPRSKYPDLALSFDNLQILCKKCNVTKGNRL